MDPTDTAPLEYHLRRLDGDALAALVEELWAARGDETDREGGTVVARAGRGEAVRVSVSRAGSDAAQSGDGPFDVVVAFGDADATDARRVGAADLAELLRYGVDRAVARELCERHLGAPPSDLPPPPLVRARRRVAGSLEGTTLALLVGAAAVAVLLVAFLWVGATPFASASDAAPGDGGAAVATPGPEASVDGAEERANRERSADGGYPSSPDTPPPGVTEEGITNLTALAAAHERAMSNRSHTVWLDRYSERVNANDTRVQHDVDMAVEGGRFLITNARVESGDRRRLGAVYHDGAVTYGAVWNESTGAYDRVLRIDPRHDLSPTPETVRRIAVTRFLSTAETNVTSRTARDGATLYRVVGTGQPNATAFDRVWNYTAVAVVDSRGYVGDLTVEFTARSSGRIYRMRHEITYDRLGSTTVEVPAWYERRAENGTAG